MLWSVLPFQALAFLKAVDSWLPISRLLPILNSEEYWLVTTPVTNGALCMACVVFTAFHFYIMEEQVNRCLLISGHWFTIMCTIWSFLAVSCHLYNHSDLGMVSSLFSFYLAYFAIFLSMASLVLKRSQLFHHDDMESKAGIEAAAWVVAIAGPAFLFVAYRTIEANRQHKIREFKECWAAALVAHIKRGEKNSNVKTVFRRWKNVTDNLEATATAVVEDMQTGKEQRLEPHSEEDSKSKPEPSEVAEPTKRVTRASAAAAAEKLKEKSPTPASSPNVVPKEDWNKKKKELIRSALLDSGDAKSEKPPSRPTMPFSASDLSGAKLKKASGKNDEKKPASAPAKPNLMAEIMNAKRDKLRPAKNRKPSKLLSQKAEPPSMMDEIRLRMQARHARMKAEEFELDETPGEWD